MSLLTQGKAKSELDHAKSLGGVSRQTTTSIGLATTSLCFDSYSFCKMHARLLIEARKWLPIFPETRPLTTISHTDSTAEVFRQRRRKDREQSSNGCLRRP